MAETPDRAAIRLAMEAEAKALRETLPPRSDRAMIATVLDVLAGLRADGFQWEEVAGAVERAGIRTAEGRVFSAERLRTYFGHAGGREIVERIRREKAAELAAESERAAAPAGPDAAKARAIEPPTAARKGAPAAPERALRAEPDGSAEGAGGGKSLKERLLGADHPSNQPPKIIG